MCCSTLQSSEPEQSAEQAIKSNLARAGAGKVVCRLCKGDHFTAKCPYKDQLPGLDGAGRPLSVFLPQSAMLT